MWLWDQNFSVDGPYPPSHSTITTQKSGWQCGPFLSCKIRIAWLTMKAFCNEWSAATSQVHDGLFHKMSFVIMCEVLWHPACKNFSILQAVMDNAMCTTAYLAISNLSQHIASDDKGTCTTHIIIGHAWVSRSLLFITICSAIIKTQQLPWYHVCSMHLQLVMNFHQCDACYMHKSNCMAYFNMNHVSSRPDPCTAIWHACSIL